MAKSKFGLLMTDSVHQHGCYQSRARQEAGSVLPRETLIRIWGSLKQIDGSRSLIPARRDGSDSNGIENYKLKSAH